MADDYTNSYKVIINVKIMSVEDCLEGNKIKHEATVDLDALKEFRAEHDAHMMKKSLDPAGQDYNFRYIPSSVGTSVHIECRCGAKKDITDYSNW